MKTILGIAFLLLVTPAFAGEIIQKISWAEWKQAGKVAAGEVLPPNAGGDFEQLKLENPRPAPVTIPLLVLDRPAISKYVYAVTGQIRYQGVEEEGYLEMWNIFPGDQRFFSRTLAKTGPMKTLQGSSGWRTVVVPFFNQEGGTHPVRLELNLVLPGKGTVYLSDLCLVQYQANENPLLDSGQSWWNERSSGLVFGGVGAFLGLLGGLIGILCSLGKARSLVTLLLRVLFVIGVASFGAGIVAFVWSQPYEVFYPLLLTGLLCTVLPLALRRTVRKRYEDLEFRRMRSMDVP